MSTSAHVAAAARAVREALAALEAAIPTEPETDAELRCSEAHRELGAALKLIEWTPPES